MSLELALFCIATGALVLICVNLIIIANHITALDVNAKEIVFYHESTADKEEIVKDFRNNLHKEQK